jgi:radical SAM superfamily enzyme YgiQ (UPF0313 family)
MEVKMLFILPRYNKNQAFVYDRNTTEPDYNYLMPVGMPYIIAYLKKHRYDIDGLNLNHIHGTVNNIVRDVVTRTHYDIIFTGGLSAMYSVVEDIICCIRQASPDTKIVIGGGLVSAQPELITELLKPDYGIVFEGEETALELVRFIESKDVGQEQVKGITFLRDGHAVRSPRREPIADLNALPYPDLDAFGYGEYASHQFTGGWNLYSREDEPRPYSIVSARGCSAACTFCFHTTGPKYRYRSVENIMAEIKYAVEKYRINFFTFLDELFSYDKERLLHFCRKFAEYQKTVPWKIEMYCNLRVDCADGEILDALKSCGNIVIGLGLESISPVVLKSMRKHITPEQTKRCLELIAERNLVPQGVFIFGDPAETLETASETLSFIRDNQNIIRGGVFTGFIIPFPGTTIYKDAVKNGIIKDEAAFIKNISHPSYEQLNFTPLSSKDFDTLETMVSSAWHELRSRALPKRMVVCGSRTKIDVVCPHCKTNLHYENTGNPGVAPVPVICRNPECNGRFDIVGMRTMAEAWLINTLGLRFARTVKKAFTFVKQRIL